MDFLNFITAIHHRLGVDIPELDYPKLTTLDGAIAYLEAKRTEKGGRERCAAGQFFNALEQRIDVGIDGVRRQARARYALDAKLACTSGCAQ